MEFVGRTVAVATADKKLKGSVAKIEEGRLHVTLRSGETAVVRADDIVDLQVLNEPVGEPQKQEQAVASQSVASQAAPRAASGSPAASRQPRARTQPRNKKVGSQRREPSTPASVDSSAGSPHHNSQQTRPDRKPQAATQASWDTARSEFDFEASHRQFDKAAVFQSIKDTTAPVANGQRTVYRPDEMVIASAPRGSRISGSSAKEAAPKTHPTLPAATALQKVQVQSYMLGQGWSASAVDECAGRGLASVCLGQLGERGTEGSAVVVLAGNHTSGARALAAGRILATRGVLVVAVLVDQAPAQLESQMPAFKASGGVIVTTQKALFAALAKPVALVVDALQGLERTSLEDQIGGPEQLAASRWLVGWANSQKAVRVAVERASTHDSLSFQASTLVSCGWPLAAEASSNAVPRPALQYVVDLGIPQPVLQKLGLPQLYINFGNKLYMTQKN